MQKWIKTVIERNENGVKIMMKIGKKKKIVESTKFIMIYAYLKV